MRAAAIMCAPVDHSSRSSTRTAFHSYALSCLLVMNLCVWVSMCNCIQQMQQPQEVQQQQSFPPGPTVEKWFHGVEHNCRLLTEKVHLLKGDEAIMEMQRCALDLQLEFLLLQDLLRKQLQVGMRTFDLIEKLITGGTRFPAH